MSCPEDLQRASFPLDCIVCERPLSYGTFSPIVCPHRILSPGGRGTLLMRLHCVFIFCTQVATGLELKKCCFRKWLTYFLAYHHLAQCLFGIYSFGMFSPIVCPLCILSPGGRGTLDKVTLRVYFLHSSSYRAVVGIRSMGSAEPINFQR